MKERKKTGTMIFKAMSENEDLICCTVILWHLETFIQYNRWITHFPKRRYFYGSVTLVNSNFSLWPGWPQLGTFSRCNIERFGDDTLSHPHQKPQCQRPAMPSPGLSCIQVSWLKNERGKGVEERKKMRRGKRKKKKIKTLERKKYRPLTNNPCHVSVCTCHLGIVREGAPDGKVTFS